MLFLKIPILSLYLVIMIFVPSTVFAQQSTEKNADDTLRKSRSVLGQMLNVADPDMTIVRSVEKIANSTTLQVSLFDSEGEAITTGGDTVETVILPQSFSGMVSETLDNEDGSYNIEVTTSAAGDADLDVIPVINGVQSINIDSFSVLGTRHFELTAIRDQEKGSVLSMFFLLFLVVMLTLGKKILVIKV